MLVCPVFFSWGLSSGLGGGQLKALPGQFNYVCPDFF